MSFTNIHEIEKIIGNMIVKQSGLDRSRIANIASIRGVNLSKFITNSVSLSYNLSDVVILFEIVASDNRDINFTEKTKDDAIRESNCFDVKLICYGNESINIIKMLKARLESAVVRSALLDEGIYFVESSSCESINDFINETIYPRTDFHFTVACEIEYSQIEEEYTISTTNININTSDK